MKHLVFSIAFFLLFLYSCEEKSDENNQRPFGTLIEVPNEVETIKEAVKTAQPYDTILLKESEFFEWNIEIDKPILITSLFLFENDSNLISQTIINANSESRIFTISEISDTLRINGITIMNGSSHGSDGGGIHCKNSNLQLTNTIISNNIASGGSYMIGVGGGMYIKNSYVNLENVKILDNEATDWSAGIYCNNSIFYANNISIERSISWSEPVTIWFGDSYINIRNSTFIDNPANLEGYHSIGFTRCEGILEKLKITNNTASLFDSSVELIDCDINWVE